MVRWLLIPEGLEEGRVGKTTLTQRVCRLEAFPITVRHITSVTFRFASIGIDNHNSVMQSFTWIGLVKFERIRSVRRNW